jgi:hypothetical protein
MRRYATEAERSAKERCAQRLPRSPLPPGNPNQFQQHRTCLLCCAGIRRYSNPRTTYWKESKNNRNKPWASFRFTEQRKYVPDLRFIPFYCSETLSVSINTPLDPLLHTDIAAAKLSSN